MFCCTMLLAPNTVALAAALSLPNGHVFTRTNYSRLAKRLRPNMTLDVTLPITYRAQTVRLFCVSWCQAGQRGMCSSEAPAACILCVNVCECLEHAT
jgi:hypothetical protein